MKYGFVNRYGYDRTLREIIEENFIAYKSRGSFLTFSELEQFTQDNSQNADDYLFTYTEMLIDVLDEIIELYLEKLREEDRRYAGSNTQDYRTAIVSQKNRILKQIDDYLERSNHEVIKNASNQYIVLQKNANATQAFEILSDTDESIAIKILEYNHYSNKGDTETKRKLLVEIGTYFMPLREKLNISFDSKIFKTKNSKSKIVDELFEMFNFLQLRHYNEDKQYIELTDSIVLEDWYDKVYNTILFVIIAEEQIQISNEFNELKKEYYKT